jgi:hypothetical protein
MAYHRRLQRPFLQDVILLTSAIFV